MTAVATETYTVTDYIAAHRPEYPDEQRNSVARLIREAIAGDPAGDQSTGTNEQGLKLYTADYLHRATCVALEVAVRRRLGASIRPPKGFEG